MTIARLPGSRKYFYDLRLCECLYREGEYETIKPRLEAFIRDHRARERALVIQALVLKGQTHVHLGEYTEAIREFLTLGIEYPRAAEAGRATFMVGYCHVLRGDFEHATVAFELLIQDYPESDFVKQAKTYLERLKVMGG